MLAEQRVEIIWVEKHPIPRRYFSLEKLRRRVGHYLLDRRRVVSGDFFPLEILENRPRAPSEEGEEQEPPPPTHATKKGRERRRGFA